MPSTTSCRRILVVDDNHDAADTLIEILQLCGHQVMPSYDGRSALKLAADFVPDVVFCDIGMPDMDGYAVAQALQQMQALRHTRVVALTAWSDAATRARSAAAGFHDHLVKPATFEELLRQLA